MGKDVPSMAWLTGPDDTEVYLLIFEQSICLYKVAPSTVSRDSTHSWITDQQDGSKLQSTDLFLN